MDQDLLQLMRQEAPKLNSRLCEGYAYEESFNFERHLDQVARQVARGLPEGMQYAGYTRVTPQERLAEVTRPKNNKRSFEISRSDMYMLRMNFKFQGQALKPRYIFIPFLRHGGTMALRDSKYLITPTLSDNLFSIEDGTIFMPVTRARFTFNRAPYHFMANGRTETVDIYWAKLHHSKKNEAPKSRLPQLVNYILTEHGLTRTFKQFFNADIVYGDSDMINDTDFPEDEWVITRTSGVKPRGRITAYIPPTLNIAVRKEDYNRTIMSALASVFYIADVCSQLEFFDIRDLDDPLLWRRALARFIWKSVDERDAIKQVDDHLASIQDYIDDIVIAKLRHEGIEANGILELFHYIVVNFADMTIHNDVAGTHNKMLTVTPNVMFPAVAMLFNMMFTLQRIDPARLRLDAIERALDKTFKSSVMLRIGSGHPEVSILESATDQMCYKISGQLHVPSKNSGKSKSGEMQDPAFWLHPEMITAHSWLMITKSSPSGRGRLNPFMQLDSEGHIIPNPEHDKFRQNLKELS